MTGPDSLGIAIPSFGDGGHVAETIRSIRSITWPFAAVVQDGGSPADTLATIERAIGDDPRFQLRVEPDDGQSDAINRAVAGLVADHPVVTWVNTDDVVHPHGISAAMRLLDAHTRTVAVYGDYLTIDGDGLVLDFVRPPRRATRYLLVYGWNYVPGVATLIRSETWMRVGGLDRALHYAMDYDLWIRLAGLGRIEKVDQPVLSFREHAGSKTIAEPAASRAEDRWVAARHQRLPRPLAELVRTVTKAGLIAYRGASGLGFLQRATGAPVRQDAD